ncbi:phosphoglucosamine mutase [Candidatus Parvarchaeota archaeon]|nr:phosphoglucosamine mutase [Candidatus Parvarchaeota archaeon]
MFGTSGIRGVANSEVGCELAVRLGGALSQAGKKAVVATDTRLAAPMIKHALVSGLLSGGAEVLDIGVVPTPVLSFASQQLGCTGVMVTASHNPPQYIGMKLFESGFEIDKVKEKAMEQKLGQDYSPKAKFDKVGRLGQADFRQQYFGFALQKIDAAKVAATRPKVVVDCANAAASTCMPYLLGMVGCQVVSVNCEQNTSFNRGLEPSQANLADTAKVVRATGALLGIAHDGDADRAVIMDEKGNVLPLDVQLALMCLFELGKNRQAGKRIVTTVEASLAVRRAVEAGGGEISITPVGSLHVAQSLYSQGGCFGGEPCGEYVYPAGVKSPDGLLSGLKFIEMLCTKGEISALSKQVKTYPIHRAKFPCPNEKKKAAMALIERQVESAGKLKGAKSLSDGLRVDFEDGWFLIRPSGTEPIMRLTAECLTQKRLDGTVRALESIIQNSVSKA